MRRFVRVFQIAVFAGAVVGVLLLLLGQTPQAAERTETVPPVIQAGFDTYAKEGADAAFSTWLKGSTVDDRSVAASADTLRQLERGIGKYKSFELLGTKKIGTNSEFVFCEMDFARGACFARFQLYGTGDAWLVQEMVYRVRPEEVMPWLMMAGER